MAGPRLTCGALFAWQRFMSELNLRLADGTLIVVPVSLQTITTYVLLEQEQWFEKEAQFVPRLLKPGMTAVDIGANVGVYSLPFARQVGAGGTVYAYEPATASRAYLERSRERNRLDSLNIQTAALSDTPRQGHLAFGGSSELHMLGETGDGETIEVTCLDEEDRVRNWRSPDFVKIDAEGEETRILEGGRNFFAKHSPLVMFEIKAGSNINAEVMDRFLAYGYRIFRLLPGAPILVPVEHGESCDSFELNLFAIKPDRLAGLPAEILVTDKPVRWVPDTVTRAIALEAIFAQPFGAPMRQLSAPASTSPYRDALAGYSMWRSSLPPSLRFAALQFSYELLRGLCDAEPSLPKLSTLARVAWDLGERNACVQILNRILSVAGKSGELREPFWPANPRFDSIPLGRDLGQWFFTVVLEQLERTAQYSSMFAQPGVNVEWLSNQQLASTEMLRRHVLRRLRSGQHVVVPERLCRPAPDHINADVWRAGLVPNTVRLQ